MAGWVPRSTGSLPPHSTSVSGSGTASTGLGGSLPATSPRGLPPPSLPSVGGGDVVLPSVLDGQEDASTAAAVHADTAAMAAALAAVSLDERGGGARSVVEVDVEGDNVERRPSGGSVTDMITRGGLPPSPSEAATVIGNSYTPGAATPDVEGDAAGLIGDARVASEWAASTDGYDDRVEGAPSCGRDPLFGASDGGSTSTDVARLRKRIYGLHLALTEAQATAARTAAERDALAVWKGAMKAKYLRLRSAAAAEVGALKAELARARASAAAAGNRQTPPEEALSAGGRGRRNRRGYEDTSSGAYLGVSPPPGRVGPPSPAAVAAAAARSALAAVPGPPAMVAAASPSPPLVSSPVSRPRPSKAKKASSLPSSSPLMVPTIGRSKGKRGNDGGSGGRNHGDRGGGGSESVDGALTEWDYVRFDPTSASDGSARLIANLDWMLGPGAVAGQGGATRRH
ncbi:hypothetical protein MMPV_007475 [Pyropia vietnamensis]